MNRGVAWTLSLTLFLAGAWSAGAWHGHTTALRPPMSIEQAMPAAATTSGTGWSTPPGPLLDEPAPEGRVDLYGNEVTDAVATYKSDRTGAVYEEHSPQTEVPRLAPPTI